MGMFRAATIARWQTWQGGARRFGVEEASDDEDPAGRQRVSGWIARAVGRRKESIERHGNVLRKNELATLQALITPS